MTPVDLPTVSDSEGNNLDFQGGCWHITTGEEATSTPTPMGTIVVLDQSVPVFGNAYHDANTWRMLYDIALNTALPLQARAQAVRNMDRLTGEDESSAFPDDAAVVADFVAQWNLANA